MSGYSKRTPTGKGNAPTRQGKGEDQIGKRKRARQPVGIAPSPKATRRRKRVKVAKKKRERITSGQEQDILTRLSRMETLKHIQGVYGKGLDNEILNLKKAFEAEEFLLKDGVWQLVS